MPTFRAVIEKRTVERMTIAIEAKNFSDATAKAQRATEFSKVRGVTVITPYDVSTEEATETVVSVQKTPAAVRA